MARLAARLRTYAARERLLTVLLVAYIVMIPLDPSLPRRSLRLLEPRVYAALVALLVASRGLELSGLPARAASRLLAKLRGRPGLLYSSIVLAAGASAAFMTNDAALFVYLPLVMSVERILGAPLTGLYVLVALSVNTLSMASPIGNPQNIYIWQHYRLSAAEFAAGMAPYTLAGLGLLVVYTA
ncbi:MAG: SLC13 family permease, partial [Desulfurococcales archaeon]|nr:SLC13 family permease [Desulfurococcales archaeon]